METNAARVVLHGFGAFATGGVAHFCVLLKRMTADYKVNWRGDTVGTMTDLQPDMSYVDGIWTPAFTPESGAFEALAGELDAKAVMDDPTKGTRIIIFDSNDPDHSGTDALVCSLTDGRLFIRRVHKPEAIEWLRNNVN